MTKITGASDDLIEIEGELSEEFNAYDCTDALLSVSDGTLLQVDYDDDGIWRFKIRFKGTCYSHHVSGSVEDDTNDEVHFNKGLKWIMFSSEPQSVF